MKKSIVGISVAAVMAAGSASAADKVFVGHLADLTGPTSFIGVDYANGIADALKFVNDQGGIDGTQIEYETIDYAYKVPQAIAQYKKWKSAYKDNFVAMQGWGTGDIEALISFVARDEVPTFSASYSAHLTDPTKKNPKTKKAAPYNFFYGTSYSDACRALVMWASEDAKSKGIAKPKFVHAGDNHPYPNAPKAACAEYAAELGLEVLPPVVVSMKGGDFTAQCLTVKNSEANYIYLGNLGGSVISMVKACNAAGVDATYMSNIWAGDYKTISQLDVKNYIFPTMTPFWEASEADIPGMRTVRRIADNAGRTGRQVHHYIRGICSAYYMKEAMEVAKAELGGINGSNIKKAMETQKDWVPADLEGVCQPSNWTAEDHRGMLDVVINSAEAKDGNVNFKRVTEMRLPRRAEWLGY